MHPSFLDLNLSEYPSGEWVEQRSIYLHQYIRDEHFNIKVYLTPIFEKSDFFFQKHVKVTGKIILTPGIIPW